MRFALLSEDIVEKDRNFLRKTQENRLLNFAGVIVRNPTNINALYDDSALAVMPWLAGEKEHVILSLPLFAEWCDVLPQRLAEGRRPDLKKNDRLAQKLIFTENWYHKEVFEGEVAKILEDRGFEVVRNIAKDSKRKRLPCGEIDIAYYDHAGKVIGLIECKVPTPIVDMRSMSQQFNDFFGQKKYSEKFERKLAWARDNVSDLASLFSASRGNAMECHSIVGTMVTKTPSLPRLMCESYRTCTFSELAEGGPLGNW